MTKEELITKVAQRSNISVQDTDKIVNAFTQEIKNQLARGEKVTIAGFGAFVLSKRGPKTFKNPKTGVMTELPERNLPHFKSAGGFKKNVR